MGDGALAWLAGWSFGITINLSMWFGGWCYRQIKKFLTLAITDKE